MFIHLRILQAVLLMVAFFLGYYVHIFIKKTRQLKLEELIKLQAKELKEQNERFEKQSEELRAHTENFKTTNELLTEKQELIEQQKKALIKTNEKLSQLNASKDKYFSIIAHDLRNSFHVVLGFSEILLSGNSNLTEEKIKRYLHLINVTSKNGNYLLENLLQWSRSQTGRMKFEPKKFNLGTVVTETIKLYESEINQKNIKVLIHVEPSLEVFADENMIQTIMRNLISNALKFTYEKGMVTIRSLKKATHVEISVEDTGIGISLENQNLLFNVETNISTQGTSHEQGTGLGLILCREFIEKHHGTIWVESNLGKGSKFIFTIPV